MGDSDRNKEEQYSNILSDFVACTGIQDEGQAIRYLENVNWDLLAAINLVLPQNSQRLPSEAANSSGDVEMITIPSNTPTRPPLTTFTNPNASIITIAPDEDEDMPTSSSVLHHRKSRLIQFIVVYNKSAHSIALPDTKTVYDLKLELFSRTGLQVCKQLLKGWPQQALVVNDQVPLSSLRLPALTELALDERAQLMTSSQNGHSSSASSSSFSTSSSFNNTKKKRTGVPSDASRLYKLNIADLTNSREYQLKYGGNTKVSAVKQDVADLSKIPPSQQVWTGWWDVEDEEEESDNDAEERDGGRSRSRKSKEDRDSLPLYKTGIGYPNHDLTVEALSGSTVTGPAVASSKTKAVIDLIDTDSSMDEYEDAACFTEEEDDNTVAEILSTRRNLQSLIPDNIEDETSATLHLIEQFESRYGPARPHFFPGTLDEAIKEACYKPASGRKILAVYLHHDSSVLANVFCSQLLCFESVLQFLANHCVVWAWDLTLPANQARFLASVSSSLGSVASHTLSSHMSVDRLPALLLITRLRQATEIFSVIHANTGVNELMSSLLQASEVFDGALQVEMREESERLAREAIKSEQDEAYQQSLAVDRAKEESKRLAEQLELEEKTRLESEKLAAIQKKEAHIKHLTSILPPEPPQGSATGPPVITVRFRLPPLPSINGAGETSVGSTASGAGTGGMKVRRFYASQPAKDVIDYLSVEGYSEDEFKVIYGWPRKEITPDISHQSLSELKFCTQETLIVEER